VIETCIVKSEFISKEEECQLLDEVEPHMKRLRYEQSHWDDAIHLYREREQMKWREENAKIIERIRHHSFPDEERHIPSVHVLDLHADGYIKPHIDSVRYCGDIISGISLLSDCVMRLRHKDQKDELIVDVWLPRRSLYKLSGISRQDFTHEILADNVSYFEDRHVPKERRISVICRDMPKQQVPTENFKLTPVE
jgi:alkylated DNA repair protein alkB family protein 7